MYNARRATGWVSVFYFVSLIIMGMMIVMNLFLAILLSNFTNKEDVDAEAGGGGGGGNREPGNAGRSTENPGSPSVTPFNPASPTHSPMGPPNGRSLTAQGRNFASTRGVRDRHPTDANITEAVGGVKVVPTANSEGGEDVKISSGKPGVVSRAVMACRRAGEDVFDSWAGALDGLRVPVDLDPGRAMLLLGPTHPLRRGCAAIVANAGFDRFILLLISVSSLALALDSPLRDPNSAMAVFLGKVERVMTGLFVVEMMLKICAHGFLLMRGAYLRNSWNVLDFVVVVISMFQLFTDDSGNLKSLRSLRALRALRPLR